MDQPAPPVGGDTRQVTDLLLQLRDGGTEDAPGGWHPSFARSVR
jgi:hypothetical protein